MIMAGGTGGHVFPGIAVADWLRARDWRVVWLGTESGMERRLVPASGYPMETIRFSGVRGKGGLAWLLLPLRLLVAFWQSAATIFRVRPDVVLGMGGYPAFPGGMMAALLLKPLAVHEQNSVPGLANRVLAQVADRVLVAFPGTLSGRNVQVTGNPVRESIAAVPPPGERFAGREGRLRLLVVGGSLGAQALNTAIPAALRLIPEDRRPLVTHQSGEKHVAILRAAYAQAGVSAEVVAFIENMAAAYAGCDLVICRAGALTVSELAAAGVASILVPFPHAVDDHQSANARFLSDPGAALLLPQTELAPERLARLIQSLDRGRLLTMAETARGLGRPEAVRSVAQACMELAA
jgi:UDP-N-acetylglucosamine--N-acetylmuramyl-(pentapeptide) pyrophosphoryl-undecaprenol N-acetylglucosamine transferase